MSEGIDKEIFDKFQDLIRNAMEKQIPHKVEAGTEGGFDWYCKCGSSLGHMKHREIRYCPRCGQRLDWN